MPWWNSIKNFFKEFFSNNQPDFSKAQWVGNSADVPVIVLGGEPICTIIVEGAGLVEITKPTQTEQTKQDS